MKVQLTKVFNSNSLYIIAVSSHYDKRVVLLLQGYGKRSFLGKTIKHAVFKAVKYCVANQYTFEVRVEEKYLIPSFSSEPT